MQSGTERTQKGSGSQPQDDSPKPHGDKLATGAATTITASELGQLGDSPKRQGDKLEHAVDKAAKR
jgi:hypothetical protein